MKQQVFREQLVNLVNQFLEEGGDAFWCFREMEVAGMELTETLVCELPPCEGVDPFA